MYPSDISLWGRDMVSYCTLSKKVDSLDNWCFNGAVDTGSLHMYITRTHHIASYVKTFDAAWKVLVLN